MFPPNIVLKSYSAVVVDVVARIEKFSGMMEMCRYRSLCVEELADKLAGKAQIGRLVSTGEKRYNNCLCQAYLVENARIEILVVMEEKRRIHPRADFDVVGLMDIHQSSCPAAALAHHLDRRPMILDYSRHCWDESCLPILFYFARWDWFLNVGCLMSPVSAVTEDCIRRPH